MSFAWYSELYRRKQDFLRWIEENRTLVEEVLERLRGGEKPAHVARVLEARGIPVPPLLTIGSTAVRWTTSAVLQLRISSRRAEAAARLAESVDDFCFLAKRLQMGTSKDVWVEEDLVRVRKAIADLQEWLDQKKVDLRAKDNSEQRWIGEKVIPFEAVLKNRDLLLFRARRAQH